MNLRIKEIRENHHYTQSDIAKVLHCSQQNYSRYESGEVTIDADKIVILADFYGTSVDYLLGLTDQVKPHKK